MKKIKNGENSKHFLNTIFLNFKKLCLVFNKIQRNERAKELRFKKLDSEVEAPRLS